jgi:hypothetical protein
MNYKEEVLKVYPSSRVKTRSDDSYYIGVECYEYYWIMKGKITANENEAWMSVYQEIESNFLRKLSL